MSEYYLVSQLPSLDGIGENTPLSITEERFLELSNRFLGKRGRQEVNNLTLSPNRNFKRSSSSVIRAWNEGERNLRMALGVARAEKMNKTFCAESQNIPQELIKTANIAVEIESPLEAEKFLNDFRLKFLETLRPADTFCEDFVFYYGLKLKLILRSRQFNAAVGENEYKNIYGSILNRAESEVKE